MAALFASVAERPIAIAQIARRGPMNFGQNWRGVAIVEVRYRLGLSSDSVVAAIDTLLPEFREDSEAHPDPDDLLESRWRSLRWLDGAHAVEDPILLNELVDFLAVQLLDDALVGGRETLYLINTIDDVVYQGEAIIVSGVAGVRP